MTKKYLFLLTVAFAVFVVGCSEDDLLPEPQIIIANDKSEIKIDAENLDSLFIPVSIISEDFLYSIKIFAVDNRGNEHIIRNYFFDKPLSEFFDTCFYADFTKTGFPPVNRLSYLGATATTIRSITKTERTPFVFTNFGIPLSEEREFMWIRVGINDGEGVADFGLKWENTISDPFALIEKDRAEKMVMFPFGQWINITHENELINAINAATSIQSFSNISTVASANYDIVLGILFNGDFFLLHIAQAIITEEEGAGKTVTITGFYKKTEAVSKVY